MKKAIIIATIIGAAATISACRERHEPLKLGAADPPVTVVARA